MYQEILSQMTKHKETQQDLANVLNIDRSQVSRKVFGKCPWRMNEIKLLCKHYNIKFEKLFRKEEWVCSGKLNGKT